MSFSGKVVLITGASSGIGAATAKHFAELDVSLALTGQNMTKLEMVAAECRSLSSKDPLIFKADLTDENDTKSLIKAVVSHFNGLDILINNAGVGKRIDVEDFSLSNYDEIFDINVRSVYHLTMLAVPYLIANKGSIVNVSSVASKRCFKNMLVYCMSKAAIDQFTRCIALELAPKGVRVNGVNPGLIKTDILNRAGLNAEQVEKYYQTYTQKTPLGRIAAPEEVAKTISFLAGSDSSFSTGVNFFVDGGLQLG